MKIFFDARWTRTDFHDGVSRYTAGLVQGFIDNNIEITVLIHSKDQLALLPKNIPYIVINNPVSMKEFFVAYKLNKYRPDVVFSPLQVMGFWGRKYKLVLTLQDIIYYHYPKPPTNLPTFIRILWRLFHVTGWPQRLLLDRSDFVTTVSATSKKFIQKYKLTAREIGVIYNAPSLDLEVRISRSKKSKNIVYMGSFMPYKNTETLIRGMSYLPGYALHLLSKISADRKTKLEKIIEPGVKVIFHNGVSDEEYIHLLTNATCLATASKEEGFGLPIVEAQILGVPVVCTDMDIFKEVAGNGALYFDADDPCKFADQVLALDSKAKTDDLVKKGFAQARTFSWKKSSATLNSIFLDIV